ncbi:hypothetical protein VTN77DRAFT_4950 [Rasamsonia byssochlamydoides]|uniref:uncharacterized protein n=1 Tax=Rasamsonia byssochlamydoides TaxID=89139 RepID=UPI00374498A3
MPDDPVKRADIEAVLKDGYVVMENLIPKDEVELLRQEITRLTGDKPKLGRHIFEGKNTIRIYSTRLFDKYCLFDRVLALNDYFLMRGYRLSATSTIQINPGEKTQLWHHAIDDFTADNGATRMVPGSHLWDSKRRPTMEESIPMVCPAGSVIYFLGTTWHCGGPNTTDKPRRAATVQYCQPFIRPVENQFLAVDPRRLPQIPDRIVAMMGYGIQKPFIGYVDGLDPLKAARRMIQWLQSPLEEYPPAFATMT